ncbi:MAG: FAD:protein FMN transferase [Candidatus Dadabacteria bacterium]|nr:MAG: FAD:protein FMN transferase [Candidatus Dadabacteria bacterium]
MFSPQKILPLGVIAVIALAIYALSTQGSPTMPESYIVITGKTMGTTYKVISSHGANKRSLQREIKAILEEVTDTASTWEEKSEISRFNRLKSTQKERYSELFISLLSLSYKIYLKSDGYFNPAIYPLVKLWGFERNGHLPPPSSKEIKDALSRADFSSIKLYGNYILKEDPEVEIDLSGIAKGYGVDMVSEYLKRLGSKSFLVEIGGEVRAFGRSPQGYPWVIGIEYPAFGVKPQGIIDRKVLLSDGALATSGVYHNYRNIADGRISHIIDPHTGYPKGGDLLSVTIYADTCAEADAVATAAVAMGRNKGLRWLNKEGYKALLISKSGSSLKVETTANFPPQMVPGSYKSK